MAGLVNWISGAGSLDLGSAQAAINELVEEREQMQARIAELEESQKLLNKTILITGAGGDIGREAALNFARQGAKTILVDRVLEAVTETHNQVAALKRGESLPLTCDVTDAAGVAAAVAEGVQKFGRIDCAFVNAGVQGAFASTELYPLQDFQQVMHINVVGSFICLQEVAKAMKADAKGGSIVVTSSVAAIRGTPAMPAYVASKAALIGLVKTAAKDLAPFNIRVNCISPALIGPGHLWDRQNALHAAAGSPYFDTHPARVAANKIASVPMKRVGSLAEVVHTVCFLLSDHASYTTGANLEISGGLT
mmetsp:Transcript_51308/g.121519  ORF Transcript_51308/g.121519 Transcript_51308/m.121519 type:complete len:308 (-) Transcript_51308:196-1119(-)|eukprot:CAMPEP_0177703734 /NCGR_PEP_ID=MMETSP0484_2-20121128/7830_1 /TAXON_ID=354590 /ORGANISM="Rhodomonas lens, Strain RHODO" /LENGTH=307 /DNA_ID=CAMNT_0019215109 /DNA_START=49 /DNA_END=972 /DNA_ORIENTATION=+